MKTLTIREAREGLSHPDRMFADSDEVLVVCRGEPVARILPVTPPAAVRKKKFCSLAAFRASQPMLDIPSEIILQKEREERF